MVHWLLPFCHTFIFAFSDSLLIQTSEIPLMASTAHLMIFTSDTDFLPFLNLVLRFLSELNVNSRGISFSCHHWQWVVLVLLVIWQELQISNSETVCSSCSDSHLSFLGRVDTLVSCNLPMSWTRLAARQEEVIHFSIQNLFCSFCLQVVLFCFHFSSGQE